jgi:hypothetical protein
VTSSPDSNCIKHTTGIEEKGRKYKGDGVWKLKGDEG